MSYNTSERSAGHVRVGNWYEELKLKEVTGIRFYPSPLDKSGSLMTTGRCISHTDKLDPKEYKSVTKEQIINPINHPEYKWQRLMQSGPRRNAVEETLRARVAAEFEAKARKETKESLIVDYTSEAKSHFTIRGFTPLIDDANVTSRATTNPPKYVTETSISFYSDSIRRGDKIGFPTTAVVSANPFRKNGAFSTDVYKDFLAKRSESNERPMPLPTVRQHREVNQLRTRLIEHVKASSTQGEPGKSVRDIIRVLWSDPQENTTGIMHVGRLNAALDQYFAFQLTAEEAYALLCTFDAGYTDHILLAEFSNFLRRVGNARRLELITAAFSTLCNSDGTWVSELAIRDRCLLDDIDGVIRGLADVHSYSRAVASAGAGTPKRTGRRTPSSAGSGHGGGSDFSVDDFFDYYIDISAEIERDEAFEELIRSTWGL